MTFWVAGAIVVAGAASAVIGSKAAKDAANAQVAGQNSAISEQQRQYDLARSDYAPYREVGYNALSRISALNGFSPSGAAAQPLDYAAWLQQQGGSSGQPDMQGGPGGAGRRAFDPGGRHLAVDPAASKAAYAQYVANFKPPAGPAAPDYSSFFKDPGYNFARTEGDRGIEQSAAARGGAASGNALRELAQYNQGLASQGYGDYYNRLAGLAGIGQSGVSGTTAAGTNAANNISTYNIGKGDARASGIIGSANAWSNGLNSTLNNFLLFKGGYFNKPAATT